MNDLTPEFDLKRLMAPSTMGGASAEQAYGEHHKNRGIKLKRKYTGG